MIVIFLHSHIAFVTVTDTGNRDLEVPPNVQHICIASNYQRTDVNGLGMRIFEWPIVNRFKLIHDDDLTFTSMDTKNGCPTYHT